MMMMSFAALMTVAEMTRNEFNEHLDQKGPFISFPDNLYWATSIFE